MAQNCAVCKVVKHAIVKNTQGAYCTLKSGHIVTEISTIYKVMMQQKSFYSHIIAP